jgi:hypothetical protein
MSEFLVLTIDRVLPARTYRRNISGEIAMTTGTQSQLELTPQEAEAVLELWARKQAEGELRSRLNVQDLAEATGLSQNEIEKLVATVRASKSTPPAQSPIHAPVKRAKPVNYFLIAVAVMAWIGILFSVALIAHKEGERSGRRTVALAPPAIAEMGLPFSAGMAVEGPMLNSVAQSIPRGLTVNFQDYEVNGESASTTESMAFQGLQSVVQYLDPEAGFNIGPEHGSSSIINALESNDGAIVNGQIQFPKMTVSSGTEKKELAIPVARVGNPSIVEAVRQEQLKRLRILANWLINNRTTPK